MPRFSLDGWSILSGVGAGRIRINDSVPPGLENLVAGGWAWRDNDRIVGQGNAEPGTPEGAWHMWEYTRSTATLHIIDDRPATATYGGGGQWVSYIAGNPVYSYDDYTTYSDRVARGCSPLGTKIFTSHENDTLYWDGQTKYGAFHTIQIGVHNIILWWDGHQFQTIGTSPAPLAPTTGGWDARFTAGGWIVQWNAGLNGLVVYQWQTSRPVWGYVLSTDERDFNHDIAVRSDGMLVVTTGTDQGETHTRLYELDSAHDQFRVNFGTWHRLIKVSMDDTYVPPIDPPDPPIDPPDPPIDPPDPVDPVDPDKPVDPPVAPEEGDTVKVGQKGMFRMWGTSETGRKVTVHANLDAPYMSLQLDNGLFITFDATTGQVIGDTATAPGGWERVTFDGNNIMVAQPMETYSRQTTALPYEWFNL